MIKPKPNITRLKRIDNPNINRLDYLRLDKNEDIIGFDKKTIQDMLSAVNAEIISAYPNVHTLYKKISRWIEVKEECIYVSCGSDGAIKAVFETYISDKDEVITIHPTYAMYYVYADMFGASLKKVPFRNDLSLPYRDIISTVSSKTKLICIANPNSPTGTIIEPEMLLNIIDFANRKNILVLIDEAYHGYHNKTYLRYVDSFKNLIITRSFTKAYGLGCARLGFAVSNPGIIVNLKKVKPIYEVNSFSVLLGSYIIDHPEITRKHMSLFNEGKEYLLKNLVKMKAGFFMPYANFVLIKLKNNKHAQFIADELRKRKILVNSGFKDKPLSNCIRVSISEKKYMKIFLDNFIKVLNSNTVKI